MARRVPRDASDAQLVASALRGDKAAFGELAGRHRRLAVRLCTRTIGDRDLATDVVQEAVVVALIELSRLSDPERFGPWLCGIALNISRQRLRQRHRLAEIPLDPFVPAAFGLDHDSDPASLAERAALRDRVRFAIANLAPGQRDAVLLFYLRGLTYREVAAELDISINAVKARLHQARTVLEPRLTDEAPRKRRKREPTMPNDEYTTMKVQEVRRSPNGDLTARRHVIVLEEQDGDRHLPIWVGPAEATALALELENAAIPRPLTYHFTANLLAAAGAHIQQIQITQLHEGTFYAVVVLNTGADNHDVDARPSDAINLAVITDAPIRVDTALLDEAAASSERHGWRDYDIASAAIATEIRSILEDEQPGPSDEVHP